LRGEIEAAKVYKREKRERESAEEAIIFYDGRNEMEIIFLEKRIGWECLLYSGARGVASNWV